MQSATTAETVAVTVAWKCSCFKVLQHRLQWRLYNTFCSVVSAIFAAYL